MKYSDWETLAQRRTVARVCALFKVYSGEWVWKDIHDKLQSSVVGWSLNGNKWSVDKWSEGLRNRVAINVRRYTDHMRFAVYVVVSFITFYHILLVLFCIIVYTVVWFLCFCLIFVQVSFIVIYFPSLVFCFIVLFCVFFVCKCVLYYCHQVST